MEGTLLADKLSNISWTYVERIVFIFNFVFQSEVTMLPENRDELEEIAQTHQSS